MSCFHVIWHSLADAPKNISVTPEGEQITGHMLTLACNTQSKPPSSYVWKKTNGPVMKEVKLQKLHIPSLQTSDSGEYICMVKNIVGKAESHPLKIEVKRRCRHLFYNYFTHIYILIKILHFVVCIVNTAISICVSPSHSQFLLMYS